jgi:Transposase, Mutator family
VAPVGGVGAVLAVQHHFRLDLIARFCCLSLRKSYPTIINTLFGSLDLIQTDRHTSPRSRQQIDRRRPCPHHGIGRPSRKNPPVGPPSGKVAAQTIPAAPSSTGRPPRPPMSVATHPGHTAFTNTPDYTTNAVEALHRSLRKIIKTRGSFPNDDAALKLLYLAVKNAGLKWRRPIEWTAAMG